MGAGEAESQGVSCGLVRKMWAELNKLRLTCSSAVSDPILQGEEVSL